MSDPVLYGHTIFCDDIRVETNGKLIFIGVYENVMFVHGEFPFLLPKFAMAVRYLEQRGVFSDEEVTLRIFLPGDDPDTPTILGPLQAVEGRKTVQTHPDSDPDPSRPQYLRIASNVILAPLLLTKPGEILVRAQCGTEIVKLGALLVTNKQPEN